MSMGNAKKETVFYNGKERTSRIPQKPLNPIVKATLLTTLKRNDIKITRKATPGDDIYTVTDAAGKMLFSYGNAWDYGYYRIYVANQNQGAEPIMVAEMDWYEGDGYTNPQQQDIFDIAHAMQEKSRELDRINEAQNSLTPEEIMALKTLEASK